MIYKTPLLALVYQCENELGAGSFDDGESADETEAETFARQAIEAAYKVIEGDWYEMHNLRSSVAGLRESGEYDGSFGELENTLDATER